MFKFRTMRDASDVNGKQLPDSERITWLGSLLRSTSLDELPELINVVRGEMALVGPRPLLMEYLPLYSREQMRRHDVLPGITGWAQINGRNAITWDEKFKFDIWYVDNKSIWLDIKIIFRTLVSVLRRNGITSKGSVSAEPFTGNGIVNGISPK
jgi:lipopolysaccharide/colanic/teichoic acid biosynthesis glycosyltransferase